MSEGSFKQKKYMKPPTPFSLGQIKKLFGVMDNPKIALASFIALRTGMRLNEVLGTKISEIEWELQRINKPVTKGGKPRVYYLDKKVMQLLRKWVSLLGDVDYLFPSNIQGKERLDNQGFYGEFKKYLQKANLWIVDRNRSMGKTNRHIFCFHSLRSTFCSFLVNSGVSVFVAKELMGHSKISTTEKHYAYLGDTTLKHTLNKVFGNNTNKVEKEFLKQEIPTREQDQQRLNTAFQKEQEPPLRDALQELQIQLVNGRITIQEFNDKANAILNVRNTLEKKGIDTQKYIG